MKKFILFAAVLAIISLLAIPPILAAAEDGDDPISFFRSMFSARRERVEQALDEGKITQEEADRWKEHFDYMEKFHEENGFDPGIMGGNGRYGIGRNDNNGVGRNGYHGMGRNGHCGMGRNRRVRMWQNPGQYNVETEKEAG
ncbi:MAG: DUF2680 domain-containing protein [Clostridiales bacterium]|nr:DUF2680 domain-containing protein [Clostridiales bacterium]